MKAAQTLLSAGLYTSSLLGIQILLMDKWLWNAAPTHALGLIIFVLADTALLAGMWKETGFATIGAALASIVQLAAMLSDVAIGQPSAVSASTFRIYLLADTAFISLLATQVVILVLAIATLAMPLAHSHRLTLSQVGKKVIHRGY